MNVQQLHKIFKANGFSYFSNGTYNLNIFAVRSLNNGSNKFDDTLIVTYKDDKGDWCLHKFPITTDPGEYWLRKPLNPRGTAILKSGQYRGAYKIAKHQGKYYALCQRKAVNVYRDNNKNAILDFDPKTIDQGLFGINIHRSNPYGKSYLINKWSAGCQVFQDKEDFDLLMALARKSVVKYGNNFTYTLFDKKNQGWEELVKI